MRIRRWGAFGVLIGLLCLASAAAADPTAADLGEARCDQTITTLEKQLTHLTLMGNILAVSGAALAALGSAVAGASTGRKSWIASAVGIVGAIVTALPKTLPDRADLQRRISLADQHRSHGLKTVQQIPLLQDKDFVIQCQQYAISRFVDCSADEPTKDVPDLPSETASRVATADPQGIEKVSVTRGLMSARAVTKPAVAPAAAPPEHVEAAPQPARGPAEHIEAIKPPPHRPQRIVRMPP